MTEPLDLAFTNAALFDGEVYHAAPTHVGVRAGRVHALGDAVLAAIGPQTEVVDLGGKLLLPGMNDAHVHPVEAGMEILGCNLADGYTRSDYLSLIATYVAEHSEEEWIIGAGWQQAAFPGGTPVRADLDAICADRPIMLSNRDHHSLWVNSEALRRAGITRDTPDPADGRIERDENGEPTGCLHEGARMMALSFAPEPTFADMYAGFRVGQDRLIGYGITSWQDALIGKYGNHSPLFYEVYKQAEERGDLIARVNGALWWERSQGVEQIAGFEAKRAAVSGGRFRA